MAYPQFLKGEGPILEAVDKIAEDPFFTGFGTRKGCAGSQLIIADTKRV